MTRRMMVRIVSLSLACAIVASGFAAVGWMRAEKYRLAVENNYRRAFSELVTGMSGIDYALQKSSISTSPVMLVALGSEVFRQSAAATSALAQLPLADMRLEKTSKFISQVGDWAYSLAKTAASGGELGKDVRDTLARLAATADALSMDLNSLSVDINENDLEFGEIARAEIAADEEGDIGAAAGIARNIAYLEQEFPEYPTLVYDGPFSEHIDRQTPMLIAGEADVGEDAARKTAAEFIGVAEDALTSGGKSGGKVPVYSFFAERDGGEVSVDVTAQGGKVIEMTDSRTPQGARLNLEQASEAARRFLVEQGYGEMKESYWTVYSDTVMINFAPVQNRVVLYPDLVKVSIALDDGSVCNFEAQGYIMNHREREIPPVGISFEQAKEHVSEALEIKGHNLAIVPGTGGGEKFVYEMQCERGDGSHCLVYLNAQTGDEEQIFILIEEENGILAI